MIVRQQRDSQAGVTLLETLVVLTIVAIMAGSLVQSVGTVYARQEIEDLTVLAARLTLVSDFALASGSDLTLQVDSTPWRFTNLEDMQDQAQGTSLTWVSGMVPDAILVTDIDGAPLSSLTFLANPQPQFALFVIKDTEVQGAAVVFDGLTAKVESGLDG